MASSRSRGRFGVASLAALAAITCFLPSADMATGAFVTWAVALWILLRTGARGYLSLEFLYLFLLGVFHLGLVVPVALGIRPASLPSWIDSPTMPTALRLFTVAVTLFVLGTRLARVPDRTDEDLVPPMPSYFWGGLVVAVIGAAVLWTGVVQLGLLSAAYSDYWERALYADVRLFGFGIMLFPIGVLISAYGATHRQIPWVFALFALVLGPLFIAGFRGHAVAHSLALLTVWVRKSPRIARRVALVSGTALLITIPAIRLARNLDRSFSDAVGEAKAMDFLLEAGGSLRPLVATVDLIDSGAEPLWWGASYGQAIARIIPNLSFSWDQPGALRSPTPSVWITMMADTGVFDRGGGIGFSGVAEPYLNFGWPGVVLFFVMLGYGLRRGEHWLGRDQLRGPIVAAVSGFVLLTVRNDTMGVARAVALSTAVVLVIRRIARARSAARFRGFPSHVGRMAP